MAVYDVIVVGGGPGGYVAAIRAAKEGKKTALVEEGVFGGTCLNRGCIPSKTLLKHAEIIEQIEKANDWGITTDNVQFDFSKMVARKNEVIEMLRQGIEMLLRAGNIKIFNGFGKVLPNKRIIVERDASTTELTGKKIIVATGSRPLIPSIPGLDTISYHTSDSIFNIDSIPKSLVIVGGGVIGVEFANIFSALRTKVTIVELGDRLIPSEDEQASKALLKSLKKKGVDVLLNKQITHVEEEDCKKIYMQSTKDKHNQSMVESEEVLIAIGRQPNVVSVEQLNVAMNGQYIKVNDFLETSEPDVFAIGDVIGNLQLAHVASAEGLVAVNNLDAPLVKMDYTVIPRCIYTLPQIASVGMTEKELKEQHIAYKAHTFHHTGNGMALANGVTDGFTKVLIEETFGEILGVVMVGTQVTEMISQASSFMYLEGTVDELATMIQPHPSLSETLFESANALMKKGIHTV